MTLVDPKETSPAEKARLDAAVEIVGCTLRATVKGPREAVSVLLNLISNLCLSHAAPGTTAEESIRMASDDLLEMGRRKIADLRKATH